MENDYIKYINEGIARLEKELDSFELKLNLPAGFPEGILSKGKQLLDREDEIHKFTDEECGEAAAKLAQYAFFLQKSINREMAKIHWLDENITKLTLQRLQQQIGATAEERKLKAIKENEQAQKMYDIKLRLERRIQSVAYLPSRVESLKETYLAMQTTKRGRRGNTY